MFQQHIKASAGHYGAAPSFFELNAQLPIIQRALVELIGTAFLLIAVIGSGQVAAKHVQSEPLVASLVVAASIAGALVGLIVALGKVSGGHFNPLITFAQWLNGERGTACTVAYVIGQLLGGIVGAVLTATMFRSSLNTTLSDFPTIGGLLSELVASAGLMTIVLGCARSTKWETGPFAVGAWLLAAIVATPSTSYANPAVTLAVVFAPGLVGLSPQTAILFVLAQIAGMFAAIFFNQIAFSTTARASQEN